ncbi:hypothetical protein BV375_12715 [Nostoc sp. 106C]|nr:hypothetical protein BV375_12715 [Nostoc sp. 106C]
MKFWDQDLETLILSVSLRDGHFDASCYPAGSHPPGVYKPGNPSNALAPQVGKAAHASVLLCVRQIIPQICNAENCWLAKC